MARGTVAIVGRPNVGKSTLFNRMIEQRHAITDDRPGVTRDRVFGTAAWNGREFTVIDTGGFVAGGKEVFDTAIREQVELAVGQADVVLLLVDARTGVSPDDHEIAQVLRAASAAPVLTVVNKVDTQAQLPDVAEFYELGFEALYPIASQSGSGTGEMMDRLASLLPAATPETEQMPDEATIPRLAIVGRPNVGKSSLVNALLGRSERVVSELPGTTRDVRDSHYDAYGFNFWLVDTAGLRRKSRVSENIEYYANLRALRAIENCDIAIIMLDATQGIEAQDLKIFSLAEEYKKGIVLVVNKWDQVEKTKGIDKQYREHIQQRIAPRSHVPIVLTSVTERQRIYKIMEQAQFVVTEGQKQINTARLNDELLPVIEERPPSGKQGKVPKIKFLQQVPARCPTFVFYTSYPKLIDDHYTRFLENQLRRLYGFWGWPLQLRFRQK
jgi:GTP-binding protein